MNAVIDLFSGIGGFTLGMSRAGWQTTQFVEIDPFCRRILSKHWPEIPIHGDIKTFKAARAAVVVGGFPCQDLSLSGKGKGLSGSRSGLWWEMLRVICEAQPRWAVIENVPALRSRGLDQVLGSLSEVGFDAEWHCIPAAAVGAPHRRDRVWVVAYTHRDVCAGTEGASRIQRQLLAEAGRIEASDRSEACCDRQDGVGLRPAISRRLHSASWAVEPGVGRMADGVPGGSHRLKALGNALVPQIAQIIGEAIAEVELKANGSANGRDVWTQ